MKEVFLSVAFFSLLVSMPLTIGAQCELSGNYNNTGQFRTALNAAIANMCTEITLSGIAKWSGDITIPPSVTLIISGTGEITGQGELASTNPITLLSGGSIDLGNNADIFINGTNVTNQLPNPISGPAIITENGLPVELLSFTASHEEGITILEWATASELNNEKFIVERSSDGRVYSPIGEVTGAGTSTQFNDYQFIDAKPLSGQNYYRLRQMDFDGTSSFSPVRSVMVSAGGNATTVFPTITSSEFFVKTTADEIMEVHLFDAQGRMVEAITNVQSQTTNIELSVFPKGSYFVVVKTTEGLSHHRMIHQ